MMIKQLLILFILKFDLNDCSEQTLICRNSVYQPRSNINYRYFVMQRGDKFKFLGSCDEVQLTSPMTRCIVKIFHKYDLFEMDINEVTGTGIVIDKNDHSIVIVTALHVIIPQYLLTLYEFIILNVFVSLLLSFLWYYKLDSFNCTLLIFIIFYSFFWCALLYISLAYLYQLLCTSSFQIEPCNNDSNNRLLSDDLECEVLSSKTIFSQAWWEDIGKWCKDKGWLTKNELAKNRKRDIFINQRIMFLWQTFFKSCLQYLSRRISLVWWTLFVTVMNIWISIDYENKRPFFWKRFQVYSWLWEQFSLFNDLCLGFIQCSKVNKNLNAYFEICLPKPFNSTSINDDSSINVIGYVGTAPSSFDLIPDPLVFFRQSLKNLAIVNGKTPAQMMIPKTFVNCSGKLRYFDRKKIYIDTPATFGFSGGPCFLESSPNEWEFFGMLLGSTKLWNYCTLLSTTPMSSLF